MGTPRPTPAEAADRRAAISSRGMAEALGELRTLRAMLGKIIAVADDAHIREQVRGELAASRHRYRA